MDLIDKDGNHFQHYSSLKFTEEDIEEFKKAFVTIEEARERRDYKKFEKPLAKDRLNEV